jgi:hypothetical protein
VIAQEYLKMEPGDFRNLLVGLSSSLNQKYPTRFKRFIIEGDSHCVEEHEYDIRGTMYWDWVLAFMQDAEEWTDLLE